MKQIILWQQSFVTSVSLQRRSLHIEPATCYVLVGMRRAGKSFLLYQHIQQLIADGHSVEEMLFINFEDERLVGITSAELHEILESYQELYGHQPIIFLDEIQNVEGWEHFARRLADEKRTVFITGSNAHMLSREIAGTLGGRYVVKEVHPFAFHEYLEFKGVELSPHWELSPQRSEVVRLFDDYLLYGGLSECFRMQDKRSWLSSLYQKILFSDIVRRKGVRNERSLQLLVKKLADCVLHPVAVKRLQNILQGDGTRISRETVGTYLAYLHEAYLTFGIGNFTDSVQEREQQKKYYFYDNGLLNLFLNSPETKLLENIVAIDLYKHYGDSLYYYNRNVEVDFYVPSLGMAVQVSYAMTADDTRQRELKALAALHRYAPLRRAVIITANTEEALTAGNGLSVDVIPIWKWLLTEEHTPLPLPVG